MSFLCALLFTGSASALARKTAGKRIHIVIELSSTDIRASRSLRARAPEVPV